MKKQQVKRLDDIEFLVALKAISYVRVSSDDQADYGTSPDKQRKANAEYASAHGIEIIETIEDDFSGFKLDRPGFTRARNYLRQGVANCLIAYNASRLSRHRTYTSTIVDELKEYGCELHLSDDGGKIDLYDDSAVMLLLIKGCMAHADHQNIVKQLREGRRKRTEEGRVLTATPPFGYTVKRTVEKTSNGRLILTDRQLERHPTEAATVHKIFELYASGEYSLNSLAKYLNKCGYRCRDAKRWTPTAIRRTLTRTAYIGQYQYANVDLKTPIIIDRGLWDTVQQQLAHNRIRLRKRGKNNYLFSGRVTCWHCKNAMSGSFFGGRKYYRCGAANRCLSDLYKTTCTCTKSYREDTITKTVFDWLQQVMTDPKTLRKGFNDFVAEQMKSHEPTLNELERVKKLIAGTEKKMDRLLDLLLDDVLDKETYTQRKQFLQQQVDSARVVQSDLECKMADLAKLPAQTKTIDELELIAQKAFAHGIPPSYRPKLIKELDVKIELEYTEGEKWAHISCIVGKESQLIVAPFGLGDIILLA